jgi:hypothetical protein
MTTIISNGRCVMIISIQYAPTEEHFKIVIAKDGVVV